MLLLAACHPSPTSILGPDDSAHFEVRVYEQVAGEWKPGEAPIAHAFSSLHAVTWGEELVVAGLRADPPGRWEERFPSLFVDALVTRDGLTWDARRYDIDVEGTSMLDPAIVAGPEGMELWFARADGMGDPARRHTQIVRTRWDGARFVHAEVWAEGQGLVDPSPTWRDGRWEVLATQGGRDVVAIEDGKVRSVAGGVTVPFSGPDGVLVQHMVDGRMTPARWSASEGLTRLRLAWPHAVRTCASPVTGTVAGRTLLVCVEERR